MKLDAQWERDRLELLSKLEAAIRGIDGVTVRETHMGFMVTQGEVEAPVEILL